MFSRNLAARITALSALVACAIIGTPGAHAAERVDVNPASLARGVDVRIPHLLGNTLTDGSTRIRIGGRFADLVGKTPYGYLVTRRDQNDIELLVQITDGERRVLAAAPDLRGVELSSNNRLLAYATPHVTGPGRTTVTVRDLASDTVRTARAFVGDRDLVGIEGNRVFLSDDSSGTVRWNYPTDKTTTISALPSYRTDLKNGLIASADGPMGEAGSGCTVLWRLRAPNRPLWRGCDESIYAFNQNGTAMATVPDGFLHGAGPTGINLRSINGTLRTTFRSGTGSLWPVVFESPGQVVMYHRGGTEGWIRGWSDGANRASARVKPRY